MCLISFLNRTAYFSLTSSPSNTIVYGCYFIIKYPILFPSQTVIITIWTSHLFIFNFIYWLQREREDWGGEKHQFVLPLICASIGWLFYVLWSRVKPLTLAYWDDALTNWAPSQDLNKSLKLSLSSFAEWEYH